jgi:hypothetical protein
MSFFWTSDPHVSRRPTASMQETSASPRKPFTEFVIGLVVFAIMLTAFCFAFQHANSWPDHASQSDRLQAAVPHVTAGESSREVR